MERLRVSSFSRPPGLVAALARGLFAREGLAVEVTRATGSAAQVRALLAGEFEVAHTAADNVMAYVDAEGADLVLFFVGELGSSHTLVARPAIADARALAGRRVGVDAPAAGYAFLLFRMLERAGLPRGSYEVLPTGGAVERLAALRAGAVDAALLGPPHDGEAMATGCRVLQRARDAFPGYPGLTAAARRSWAAARGDLLVRYSRALLAGLRWSADPENRTAVLALLEREHGDRAVAERVYADEVVGRERIAPSLAEAREALARVARLRREMLGSGRPVDLERYFDPSFALAADPALAQAEARGSGAAIS